MKLKIQILTENGEVISLQDPVWDEVTEIYLDEQQERYNNAMGGFQVTYSHDEDAVYLHVRTFSSAQNIKDIVKMYDDSMRVVSSLVGGV